MSFLNIFLSKYSETALTLFFDGIITHRPRATKTALIARSLVECEERWDLRGRQNESWQRVSSRGLQLPDPHPLYIFKNLFCCCCYREWQHRFRWRWGKRHHHATAGCLHHHDLLFWAVCTTLGDTDQIRLQRSLSKGMWNGTIRMFGKKA